jgi:hypothetical protein
MYFCTEVSQNPEERAGDSGGTRVLVALNMCLFAVVLFMILEIP